MVFLKFVIACKNFLKSFEDFQKLQHINNELFSFVSVTKNLCVSYKKLNKNIGLLDFNFPCGYNLRNK